MKNILKDLVMLNGIPGNERQVREYMTKEMNGLSELTYDNLGSVIGKKVGNPDGPRIMVAGHMDEVGFMVTTITDEGYVKFTPAGGWWSQVMLAQQMVITTSDDKEIRGVIGAKAPHILTPEERSKPVAMDKMYLDLGIANKEEADILLIEVGGTVGDIESLPFLEAVRQLRVELGSSRALCMHLTLVPYIATAGEMKTKPTQHSVKELRTIGIQPDILLCRSEMPLDTASLRKISLFTNVEERAVISLPDANTIYRIPSMLNAAGLDDFVVEKLHLECDVADLSEWVDVAERKLNPEKEVTIAMVGKYMDLLDAYKSLIEAMDHAGIRSRTKVKLKFIDSEAVEREGLGLLEGVDGIVVPGGFGHRGVEGKINTVRYARENKIPFLGICLGMQVAFIEFARHVALLEGANSTEFERQTKHPVIGLITEWIESDGKKVERTDKSDLGGTMRLGAQACKLKAGTVAAAAYGAKGGDVILEMQYGDPKLNFRQKWRRHHYSRR